MRRFCNPFVFALGTFLVFVFWLNHLTPFCSDDYGYGLISGSAERLGTVMNAWTENWRDGHRPVVHFLVRLFAGVTGKPLFNFCNTVMVGVLVLLVLRLAKGVWKPSFRSLVLAVSLVFLLLFKGESYLWCSGSVNYLWSGCGMLAFMLVRERLERGTVTWPGVGLLSVPLVPVGWSQEAFSMPICLALGTYCLFHLKQLDSKRLCAFAAYGIGAALLAWEALQWMGTEARSAAMTQDFSAMKAALGVLKIAATVRVPWIVLVIWLLGRDRRGFMSRNAFELLVVLGSVLMILVIGFYGERSLWPANLAAIVIVVREFSPNRPVAAGLSFATLAVLCCVCALAVRIRGNFDRFERMYLAAEDGLSIHERVACGPFARYLFQWVFDWQSAGTTPGFFARYHGRPVMPKALTEKMHESLYLRDEICRPENVLPGCEGFYTTPEINAIVMPIADGDAEKFAGASVQVEYASPRGILEAVRRTLAQSDPPPVPAPWHPVVLRTGHGGYLLIGKQTRSEGYIRRVDVRVDVKHGD